ncbi:coat protein [ssRNA phage Esthiorhiza.2_18]|uniref:Coat protein n=2 Tax=Leviviricetes TaxID=2842243 RepID=A0A8S5L283_9VIRU|nr:coat protein [ssRNA phage Esthiorhiza.2_18]QDH89733.1 MAG: hypothetical protein H2RhizoLitter491370_000002 [Leviviridae sp.]DAD51745.1 TPA_asm: coat protein [ssRNA phage Esthiorhiza.2_18]
MFSDPQSVTIGGVATSLPRVGSGIGNGVFSTPDSATTLTVSHSYGKRNRRTAKLATKLLATDPITPSNNIPVSGAFYVVADFPVQGITPDQQKDLAAALAVWLTASTNANLIKLLGGEA